MDELNMNELLERTEPETQLKNVLMSFQENKHDLLLKKGVYIYGEPGIGKTNFVLKILKEMNYIRYNKTRCLRHLLVTMMYISISSFVKT